MMPCIKFVWSLALESSYNKMSHGFGFVILSPLLLGRLPFSIRVLLEAAIRNCDQFLVKKNDVENILNWNVMQHKNIEVPFKPARVILQDFT